MTIFPVRSSQFVVNTQGARSHNLPTWDSPSFGVSLTQWVPSELKAHMQTASTLYLTEVTTGDVYTECLYTEWIGVAIAAPYSYSKVLGLESWPRCCQPSWLRVSWFSAVPSGKCRVVSRLGHNGFIPNLFPNHHSPYHSKLYSPRNRQRRTLTYKMRITFFLLWMALMYGRSGVVGSTFLISPPLQKWQKKVNGRGIPGLNYLSTMLWRRKGSGGIGPPFLTPTLDGGSGQLHVPTAGLDFMEKREISCCYQESSIDPSVVQSVADWAISTSSHQKCLGLLRK
jgi:hypothetical protein